MQYAILSQQTCFRPVSGSPGKGGDGSSGGLSAAERQRREEERRQRELDCRASAFDDDIARKLSDQRPDVEADGDGGGNQAAPTLRDLAAVEGLNLDQWLHGAPMSAELMILATESAVAFTTLQILRHEPQLLQMAIDHAPSVGHALANLIAGAEVGTEEVETLAQLVNFAGNQQSETIFENDTQQVDHDLFIVDTFRRDLKDPSSEQLFELFGEGGGANMGAYIAEYFRQLNDISPEEIFEQFPDQVGGRPILIVVPGLTGSPDAHDIVFEGIRQQFSELDAKNRPIVVGINWNAEPYSSTNTPDTLDGINFLTSRYYQEVVSNTGSNIGAALELFQREHPASQISIVGHSVGVEIALGAVQNSDVRFKDVVLIQGASVGENQLGSDFNEVLDNSRITGSLVITYNPNDTHPSGIFDRIGGQRTLSEQGYSVANNYSHIHNVSNQLVAGPNWDLSNDPHGQIAWTDFGKLSAILDCLDLARTANEISECLNE